MSWKFKKKKTHVEEFIETGGHVTISSLCRILMLNTLLTLLEADNRKQLSVLFSHNFAVSALILNHLEVNEVRF